VCLLLYTFLLSVTNELYTFAKNKEISITLNKHTVEPCSLDLKRYRTTDLFVTRIKKNFIKIDKIIVLQPVTVKIIFPKFSPANNANLAKFKLIITVLTLFC